MEEEAAAFLLDLIENDAELFKMFRVIPLIRRLLEPWIRLDLILSMYY